MYFTAAPIIPGASLQRMDRRSSMDDKKTYNKVMLIALCIILILLCAGIYSYIQGYGAMEIPLGRVKVVRIGMVAPFVPLL